MLKAFIFKACRVLYIIGNSAKLLFCGIRTGISKEFDDIPCATFAQQMIFISLSNENAKNG